MIAFGTFDNFNARRRRREGHARDGHRLIYDTLMTPALDEVSTEYGLLAEAVQLSGGFLLGHLPAARQRASGTTACRSRPTT